MVLNENLNSFSPFGPVLSESEEAQVGGTQTVASTQQFKLRVQTLSSGDSLCLALEIWRKEKSHFFGYSGLKSWVHILFVTLNVFPEGWFFPFASLPTSSPTSTPLYCYIKSKISGGKLYG